MHEGAWSARLGIPGRPAEAESSIVARDLAAREAHRRPLPRAARVVRGSRSTLVRAAKAEGVRVTAECTPQHLVLTDEACAGFDPVVQDEPAAARAGRRRRAARRRSLDGTIDAIATDHAPHAPETKDAPFEEAPPGHARRRDRARGRAHDARRAGRAHARRRRSPRCRGARRASPASTRDGHGGPIAAGRPAQPLRDRPRVRSGSSTATRLASRSTQHTLGRLEAHRQGPPHDLRREPDRPRQRAHPMSSAIDRQRQLVLPTATTFEGVAVGAPARRSGAVAGEVVFNTALVRLPGDRHRPVVRGADHHVHVPAHRQLRRSTSDDDEARASALPRRDRARPRAPAVELAGDRRPRRLPRAATRSPASRASTPAGSRATSAPRARCPARSASPTATTLLAAAQADGGTDGRDLVGRGHDAASRTRSAPTTRASSSSRTTSGSSARSSTSSSRPAARSRSCPPPHRAAEVLAREPDGVFLSNGPGDPAAVDDARDNVAALLGKRAGVRHLPRPPDHGLALGARDVQARFGHHGGNHPVRHLATGRVEITSQNHNYAVDADSLPDGSDGHAPQPQRRRRRGRAHAAHLRAFSVQYHPEAGPGPARRALPVRGVHRPHAGGLDACRGATTSRRSC